MVTLSLHLCIKVNFVFLLDLLDYWKSFLQNIKLIILIIIVPMMLVMFSNHYWHFQLHGNFSLKCSIISWAYLIGNLIV